MPIGKNSIKRVANNGYSNLESRAPDMENSTVVEKITPPEAPEEAIAVKEPKKKAEKSEKPAPVSKKTVEKKPKKAEKSTAPKLDTIEIESDATYVSVGEDMPVYLL